ncbi:MAG: type II toxin-antitoxin system HicA family toxin [Nitrospirae bacterium]|uniref:type II toxin-antitoxin system HicA family toxin n=1 Tax=Candidatus Magnetobacterium casense TaxID=1455061 RepID=UPI0009E08043|nr:type II toxin-antitoxin system HicA family toxin [Nitrospirota bacterium]
MKRKELLKHLRAYGAELLREGRRHSIYVKDNKKTQIPRHTEIVDELVNKICKDLGIPL